MENNCCYQCSNENLEDFLKIVKSPDGQNCVWNKDNNTVYYNKKSILNTSLINKESSNKNIKHHETMKEIYKTIQLAKSHEDCSCDPCLKAI